MTPDSGTPRVETAPASPAVLPAKRRIAPALLVPWLALLLAVSGQAVLVAVVVIDKISAGWQPAELTQQLPKLLTTPVMTMALLSCGQVAFGLGAVVPAWLSPTPFGQRLRLVRPLQGWSICLSTTLGSLPILAVALGLADALAWVLPPDESMAALFAQISLWDGAAFVLLVALAPGVCEELLFRGYVQSRLLERWSPFRAIATVSAIFAVMHVTPHGIVAALPLGVWFGVIAWRTGSVIPGICCHAFVNGTVNLWRLIVKLAAVPDSVQWVAAVVGLLLGTACFVTALRTLLQPVAIGSNETQHQPVPEET